MSTTTGHFDVGRLVQAANPLSDWLRNEGARVGIKIDNGNGLTWTIAATVVLLVLGSALVASRTTHSAYKHTNLPFPPGPPQDPVLGNEKQRPSSHPYRTYAAWRKQYGDVIYLRYGTQRLVVLNSARAAVELLDQRSAIYSSRPPMIMAHEMAAGGLAVAMTPAGALFRKHRKAFHSAFGPRKLEPLKERIEMESRILCKEMLKHPQAVDAHYKRFAASIVFSTVYDCRIESSKEPVLEEIAEANRNFLKAFRPEGFLIDRYPILRYLPTCISPWRKLGKQWFKHEFGIYQRYYNDVQRKIDQGKEPQCIAADVIRNRGESGLSNDEATYVTGSMIAAGSDSTAMTLSCLTMAACLFPEAVKRCQRAIDQHVGNDRLPSYEDAEQIPLCKAFVQEVLRWRPFAPGGAPHFAQKDDVYRGWRIPKNTTVMANVWAIHNDEDTWDAPLEFQPERHLDPIDASKWPSSRTVFTFGFGRRICPGKSLATMNLDYASLLLLWAFDFKHAKDAHGNEIPIDADAFEDGVGTHPMPYECDVQPRSEAIRNLLTQEQLDL